MNYTLQVPRFGEWSVRFTNEEVKNSFDTYAALRQYTKIVLYYSSAFIAMELMQGLQDMLQVHAVNIRYGR